MTRSQALQLLCAVCAALNVALVVGILTSRSGAGDGEAALSGGSAAGTALFLYFAAVATYR